MENGRPNLLLQSAPPSALLGRRGINHERGAGSTPEVASTVGRFDFCRMADGAGAHPVVSRKSHHLVTMQGCETDRRLQSY
jgi:hypothetical protein